MEHTFPNTNEEMKRQTIENDLKVFLELILVIQCIQSQEGCFEFILSPKKVVGCRGGNQNVEGDPFTFGSLMFDDSLGFLYYRLFNIG